MAFIDALGIHGKFFELYGSTEQKIMALNLSEIVAHPSVQKNTKKWVFYLQF